MSGRRLGRMVYPLGLAAAFALSWAGTRAVTQARSAPVAPAGVPVPAPEPTTAAYDSATRRIDAPLTPAARAQLAGAVPDGRAALVVLRGVDCLTCEDLGRQMRELRAAAGPSLPLVVAADSASQGLVRAFLRRERMAAVPLLQMETDEVLQQAHLYTPAALVAAGGDRVTGVAHPRRFSNTRVRSFAAELKDVISNAAEP